MTQGSAKAPVVLVICDGFGYREEKADNAEKLARMPVIDRLWAENPHSLLRTDGEAVGLPEGQMGNSEVGHMTIGSGRVILQGLTRISRSLADREKLAAMQALAEFTKKLQETGGFCHLIGLVSDGGVHSHQDHALVLARYFTERGIRVYVHAVLDGRDTPPRSAEHFLQDFIGRLPAGAEMATLSGRYYAMDRDKRWERVKPAYEAITAGKGRNGTDSLSLIQASYEEGIGDEFFVPAVLTLKDGSKYTGIKPEDGVFCFNFRADRMRELAEALAFPDFTGFEREAFVQAACFLSMTSYSDRLSEKYQVLFLPEQPQETLGEVISKAGLKQLRVAETEKYAHVTYFFNGGREEPFPLEARILIPSPKVATYDLKPEMSAPEVAETVAKAVRSGEFAFITVNFANPDMVGHTGNTAAAIAAVEATDQAVGRILQAVKEQKGILLLTADHGNCELMVDPVTGKPHTAHTTFPVPFILADMSESALSSRGKIKSVRNGTLADPAPTILELLGLKIPTAMTGRSLLDSD